MKILVLGGTGFLGRYIVKRAEILGLDSVALGSQDVDLASLEEIEGALNRHSPNVIINAAAFMPADACEVDPSSAFRINMSGQDNVCLAARGLGIRVIYISSDFVFDGSSAAPYSPTSIAAPLQTYGVSKRGGELVTLAYPFGKVIRTASLFGDSPKTKRTPFVSRMMDLLREEKHLDIATNLVMSPSSASDVAAMICAEVIRPSDETVLHATNEGEASWFDLAVAAADLCSLDSSQIRPVTSDTRSQAARPRRSTLSPSAFHGVSNRSWKVSLAEFIDETESA